MPDAPGAQHDVVDVVCGGGSGRSGSLLVDLDAPVRRVRDRVGDVVHPDVGVGVEQSAVAGGVDRLPHRCEVVADDEERATFGDGGEDVVDAAVVGCARDRRVVGRDEIERLRRVRVEAVGVGVVRSSIVSPRSCATVAMRSRARWEMSLAVTLQPCSASQTASPPSPAPTSSARPGSVPSISLTRVPFGLPLQICASL